jgi:hypothetical protein
VSEQNPPAAQVPEVPSPPQQSAGSDSTPETAAAATVPSEAPASVPTQPTSSTARETMGDAPRETIGSAPSSADTAAAPAATLPAESVEPEVKPRRRGGVGLIVTAVLLALALIGAGSYYFLNYRNSPARAGVGDCLSGSENPADVSNIKLIDCSDKNATFKVTKKITNQPKDVNDSACAGIDHDDVYWYGREGQNGTVLCLLKLNG